MNSNILGQVMVKTLFERLILKTKASPNDEWLDVDFNSNDENVMSEKHGKSTRETLTLGV